MYIFNRQRMIDGAEVQKAMSEGPAIAEFVTELTGVAVSTWVSQFHPLGASMAWSARFESMAELDDKLAVMATSADYQKRAAKLDSFFEGQAVDNLVQIVGGATADSPPSIVGVVQAEVANTHHREARAWGVETAVKVSKALDVPVAFGVAAYGPYAGMTWITSYQDASEIDQARSKLMVDDALQELIDEGGEFLQANPIQFLLRRIN